MNSPRGLFVAGTDTNVGKTRVAAALIRAYANLGHRVVGMKPVAAGAERLAGAWVNEDVMQLRAAGNVDVPLEQMNPYLFREAIAPHIAAEHKGVRISVPLLRAAFESLSRQADLVVVEGAGGLLVPLSATHDMAHLAVALDLPVVLVVGMRLGCLNHALLTMEAMSARGLKLAGWVANRIDPDMAAYDENLSSLAARLPGPMLCELPYQPTVSLSAIAGLFPPRRLVALLEQP
jgi:dethiobiotin synthetase